MSTRLFSGSSHPDLAQRIAAELGTSLGKRLLTQFPDGELAVEIQDNVHDQDVFVVQSIAGDPNRYLVELLIMIDALKRSSAKNVGAIIPYLGYCRQDRKNKSGVAITAKLVANLLSKAGATRLITCDLHADQIEGFFEIPVDHLRCQRLLAQASQASLSDNFLVVAPDIGSVKIAEEMAKMLNTRLVIVNKQRIDSFNVTATLIGDVSGKDVLIVDDLCSTGGTLAAAIRLCRNSGAKKVAVAVTHALFVGDASGKIEECAPDALFITDTIPPNEGILTLTRTVVLSTAPLIAEAVIRLRR